MTVGDLLARVSSQELTEWGLFWQIKAAEMKAKEGGGGSAGFDRPDTMGGF